MRPNIDIPSKINQQVKDLKMVTDANELSQAYIKALKAGLRQYPDPSYPSGEVISTSFDIESIDFIRFANENSFSNIIWSKYLFNDKKELVTFSSSVDSKSRSEFKQIVRAVKPYLSNNISDNKFTISQYSGQWTGKGIQDFASALENQEERYEKWSPRKIHDREKGIFLGTMKPGGLLIIYFQRRVGEDLLENGSLEFITDGFPLETRPYKDISSVFGSSLTNAHLSKIPVNNILNGDKIIIDPNYIQELRYKNDGVNEMIESIKIDNIITQEHVTDLSEPKQEAILGPDKIICYLRHHRLSSDHHDNGTSFWIDNLKIRSFPTYQDPLFEVQCTADWQNKNK